MSAGKRNLHDHIQRTHHWSHRDSDWWLARFIEGGFLFAGITTIFMLFGILALIIK